MDHPSRVGYATLRVFALWRGWYGQVHVGTAPARYCAGRTERLSRFILTGHPRSRGARVYSIYAVIAVSLDLSGTCNLIGINSPEFKGYFRTIWLDWEQRKSLDN